MLGAIGPAQAAEQGAAAHEGAPHESPAGAPIFVNLRPIVLPVIEGNTVTRQVGVVLALELVPGHDAEEFEPHRRQLMDAFIRELHRLYDSHSNADRVVDARVLKDRLQRRADAVLGPGFVRAVLIRQVREQQRPG